VTELLVNTAEITWYTIVAAIIGRRTMRANWSRMHDMHTTVLGRMQAVERLIVEHGLGRTSTGRHVAGFDQAGRNLCARPERPESTESLSVLLCQHAEHLTEGLPPRRARILHRLPVIAGVRITPVRAGVVTVVVMLLAAARAAG
jgi:hypothetical protein